MGRPKTQTNDSDKYMEILYEMEKSEKKPTKTQKGSQVCSMIFTLIIMLTGASLTTLGCLILSDPLVPYLGRPIGGKFWYAGNDHDNIMSFLEFATIATILQGGLVVFFMILACIGIASSKHTAHCYIGTYLVCLIISLAFSAVLFIQGIPPQWNDDVQRVFQGEIIHHYEGSNGTNDFTTIYNNLQSKTPCCGVSGPQEYTGPGKLNFTSWLQNTDKLPGGCNVTQAPCITELMDKVKVDFGLLAGFSLACIVLQIPAFLNALCLCSAT